MCVNGQNGSQIKNVCEPSSFEGLTYLKFLVNYLYMKHKLIPFSSKQFTIAGTHFVAEASDLNNRHLQPLYDDACDVGFAIQSETTGKVIRFYMDRVHTDIEGELTHWTYLPVSEDISKYPTCAHLTATVFND